MSFEGTLSVGGGEGVREVSSSLFSTLSSSTSLSGGSGGRTSISGGNWGQEGSLVPTNILEGGSGKEKGWFYFTARVAGGRSRNLFTAGLSFIKGWKEKFFFVDDIEWGKGDGEVEKDEVKRLERGGGELTNIMYLTSPKVVESFEIYGRSSLSTEEMNRLRAGGKLVRLPKKRSRALAPGAQEERVGGGPSRPYSSGGSRDEVGPSSEPKKGATKEVAAQKRPRVEKVQPLQVEAPVKFVPRPPPVQINPALRQVEAVVPRRGKSSVPYPRDEVATNGGSGIANLMNAMAVEFFDCLQERIALVKKNEELSRQKEEAEKNFAGGAKEEEMRASTCKKGERAGRSEKSAELAVHNSMEEHVSDFVKSTMFAEVVDLYHLPTLVMVFANCRKKVKAQNPEVDVTSITFGPEEAGVEENGDSNTAKFCLEVKLTWEWDEVGKTILPSTLDFEFVVVDEEEAEVAPRTEVADNMRNEEVDQ
ncbi:hypothetical protein SLEP1_g56776 [Rubroshorea leprosula]|uniref:Uncharacterized protein n=1 Tax=Rubroshorea leprosula TaxID=152421 RepID=A0AAV5MJR0_9ROSI|nr:hypothetical protein SLEP1_g56776 [Rubroshorea leprosula]